MTTILDCGHEPSQHSSSTTGYGRDADGKTFCYDCCAYADRQQMERDGVTTLYLCGNTSDGGDVTLTNWPGSLVIHPWRVRKGYHNMARSRYDVWFNFNGAKWHGVQYGENTQICHCKRMKSA